MFKTIKQAQEVCHTLSDPSKMPCYGYNIPAKRCITGSKLRKVENSICSKCYALKGRYVFPNVLDAMEKRYHTLFHDDWSDAMAFLINKKEKSGFFRWHDSGDIQGIWHLQKIAEVALQTPKIVHWLPTREYSIVEEYVRGVEVPSNLIIRLSAHMLDAPPPTTIAKRLSRYGTPIYTSGVSKEGYNCPASKQDNECRDCRECWESSENIIYKRH